MVTGKPLPLGSGTLVNGSLELMVLDAGVQEINGRTTAGLEDWGDKDVVEDEQLIALASHKIVKDGCKTLCPGETLHEGMLELEGWIVGAAEQDVGYIVGEINGISDGV